MFQPPLQGLIAATITPLDGGGEVNLAAIEPMISRLIESGVTGLYVCGSTGEGMRGTKSGCRNHCAGSRWTGACHCTGRSQQCR